jgi:hypothetical protein
MFNIDLEHETRGPIRLAALGTSAFQPAFRYGGAATGGHRDSSLWGSTMSYRIIYNETTTPRAQTESRQGAVWTEEFSTEHQALGRARELLETGQHNSVALHDHSGNELYGVRLQWRLGGFTGE